MRPASPPSPSCALVSYTCSASPSDDGNEEESCTEIDSNGEGEDEEDDGVVDDASGGTIVPFAVPGRYTLGVDGRGDLFSQQRSRRRARNEDDSADEEGGAGHRDGARQHHRERRAEVPLADRRGRPRKGRPRARAEDDDDSLDEEEAHGSGRRHRARSPSFERREAPEPLADTRGRPLLESTRWTPERLEIKISIESKLQGPFRCPGILEGSNAQCTTQTSTWPELMQHMADRHKRYLCDMTGCRKCNFHPLCIFNPPRFLPLLPSCMFLHLPCPCPARYYSWRPDLHDHFPNHFSTGGAYACIHCAQRFTSKVGHRLPISSYGLMLSAAGFPVQQEEARGQVRTQAGIPPFGLA